MLSRMASSCLDVAVLYSCNWQTDAQNLQGLLRKFPTLDPATVKETYEKVCCLPYR